MMTSAEFADIVIPAALVVLVSIGVFVLAEAQRWLKARTTALEFQIIQTLAEFGARAAQQEMDKSSNQEKKDYALRVISEELSRRGLHIDPARLGAWVEAAVARLKSGL